MDWQKIIRNPLWDTQIPNITLHRDGVRVGPGTMLESPGKANLFWLLIQPKRWEEERQNRGEPTPIVELVYPEYFALPRLLRMPVKLELQGKAYLLTLEQAAETFDLPEFCCVEDASGIHFNRQYLKQILTLAIEKAMRCKH